MIAMPSNLLINFVKDHTKLDVNVKHDHNFDDIEVEPMLLKIQTDRKGQLIKAHQIHHYWY